ncbi:MAG: GxxExxY protein [FCB group bacterium]|nr:GxxExxY protein [FCB group bacterium]MBL7028625.1 GxxExxY protein [Candidatus Neomarinimicrobiota bacterium]MBL7121801.1 GxxExxY protein [Candidatus Neomarinimicrobiota bacterium]
MGNGKLSKFNKLSEQIIGAAIEVHKTLGPGLLESAYEAALFYELSTIHSHSVLRQVPVNINYKGQQLDVGYRIDLLVNDMIILELKTVDKIADIHLAQILTYLKLSDKHLGLIINFYVRLLKNGIKRVLHNI